MKVVTAVTLTPVWHKRHTQFLTIAPNWGGQLIPPRLTRPSQAPEHCSEPHHSVAYLGHCNNSWSTEDISHSMSSKVDNYTSVFHENADQKKNDDLVTVVRWRTSISAVIFQWCCDFTLVNLRFLLITKIFCIKIHILHITLSTTFQLIGNDWQYETISSIKNNKDQTTVEYP